ncbi:alpha/beta hydrolase [Nonomuraea sp. LPB2021202275-12-8]|uniref:alpha/beta hydrolase n=1 Tax=Nonomuraea sp. LPB2021202275-12-8 TaxID=3120159 RepID=UPI00300CDAB6
MTTNRTPEIDPCTESYLRAQAAADLTSEQEMGAAEARELNRTVLSAEFGPVPAVGEVRDHLAGEVPVRVFRPSRPAQAGPAVLYVHGGGWTVGDLDTHAGVSRALCAMAGVTVVAVDYRLAPDHRYPAALDDCETALAWLVSHAAELDVDPDRIGIVGDSAGGNLVAAMTLRARDGGPGARCQVLVYPPVDSTCGSESYVTVGTGYGLDAEGMRWYWANYLGENPDQEDTGHSPARARDLGGLPPTFVITAELDPLRDEGESYGRKLAEAGNLVTMKRFKGTIHGFFRMPGTIRLGQVALTDAAAYLHACLRPEGPLRDWSELTFEETR